MATTRFNTLAIKISLKWGAGAQETGDNGALCSGCHGSFTRGAQSTGLIENHDLSEMTCLIPRWR